MDVCPKTSKMKNFFEKIKSAEFFEKQKVGKMFSEFFKLFKIRFFVLKNDKNGQMSKNIR